MIGASPPSTPSTPAEAAGQLRDLGFLAKSDMPDRPGPAYLLVILREAPSLHHYDPEAIDYWVTVDGRGVRRTLDRHTALPLATPLAWGAITLVDRLQVTNEYLTFGGRLVADRVDGAVVAVITSATPILRRGGHSQGWDPGAESVGAFFGRLMIRVDYVPGFEGRLATVDSITRYAAFLIDAQARAQASVRIRASQPDLWITLDAEARRLRTEHPREWALGSALIEAVGLV